MSQPAPEEFAAAFRSDEAKYAERWAANAAKMEEDAHYAWMSGFVSGYRRLVEVGIGDGRSTAQLCGQGHQVVGIEVNPSSLQAAEKLLRSRQLEVEVEMRGDFHFDQSSRSFVNYRPVRSTASATPILLIEGDVVADTALHEWLKRNGPHDALICWNIGANGIRTLVPDGRGGLIQDSELYRLQVQNRCYELADLILRPGGILHIVDRAILRSEEELRRTAFEAHRDQASVTRMQVEDHAWRPTGDPNVEGGIAVRRANAAFSPSTPTEQFVIESIVSRKR